ARKTGAFRWLSGIFWGMLLWVVWGLMLLSFGLPFTALSTIGGMLIAAFVFLIASIRLKRWTLHDVTPAVVSTLLVFGGSVAALRYNCVVLSYDSCTQIILAKPLAHHV